MLHDLALRPESDRTLNLISLCTGGGGLDRAVELAIPGACPIVCVEREAFAVASLVAQIENGLMAPAAIHGDVRTFPGRRFRGRVDGVIGGIPCQPHSLAGRRGGSTDERDLWSSARRIIAQARPWFVLIENVGGFLSAGADEVPGAARVRRDLRKLGFQSTLVLVRADQVGLPHERLRAFILGVADWFVADGFSLDRQRWGEPGKLVRAPGAPEEDGEQRQRCGCAADGCGCGMGDADRQRQRREGDLCEQAGAMPAARGGIVVHAERSERRAGEPGRHERHGSATGRRQAAGRLGAPGQGGAALGVLGALPGEQRLADGNGAEPPAERRDTGEVRGLSEGEGGPEHGSALPGGSRPFLRPPGPGDYDAWRHVALVAPGLLPAVSRYDRLRLEMGAQGFVADGDPSSGRQSRAQARKSRRGAGQGASHWLDAASGDAVGSSVVQAAVERALRGVADVMAPRIDELRMLGNGVADAQGALAVRIGVHDLAARGSAGAALLVRMMEEQE